MVSEDRLAAVVFLATILSVILQRIQKKVGLPLQIALILAGFGYQVVTQDVSIYDLRDIDLKSINTSLLLLILIPASVFPFCFSLEWFMVRQQAIQLFLLSTVAPAASAAAIAASIAYILRYESTFSWSELILLGISLTLIEHTNVVYQLKSVHASEHLETLVQGEALANTGTTVVAFLLAIERTSGDDISSLELTERVARLALGGIALGLAAAATVEAWMRRTGDTAPHIVFLIAFLTYYVAGNTELDVGGALAIVSFAFYLCAYGKLSILPSTETELTSFWSILKDNIEAIVLFLGGVFFALDAFQRDNLRYKDFVMIFPLFGLLHLIRFIVILVLLPVLKWTGYGITLREGVVLAVGTTKGAIMTALGITAHNAEGLSPKLQDIVLVWTVGVCGLSLLFDSLITRFTLQKLGLESLSNAQEDMLVSVTTSILNTIREKILQLKKDFAFKYVNWSQVQKCTGSSALLMDVLRSTRNGKAVIRDFGGLSPEELFLKFTETVVVTDQQIEVETRYRFYTTLKGLYWKRMYGGKLSARNIDTLLSAANQCLDHTQEVMFDWYVCEKNVFPNGKIHWMMRLGKMPICGRWITYCLQNRVINAYDVAWNFIHAHIDAERLLSQLEIDIDKRLFIRVMHESHAQIELCRRFIRTKIADMFPELNEYVQTSRACSSLLHAEKDLVEQAYDHGTLIQREHTELLSLINSQIASLQLRSTADVLSIEECIRRCEIFARMYEPDVRDVIELAREVIFHPKEFIYQTGEPIPGVFLIQKGRVEEYDNDFFSDDRGVGSILGLHYLVKPAQSGLTTARALTSVAAVMFPMNVLQVFERNAAYLPPLWSAAIGQLLNLYIYDFGPLWELEAEQQGVVLSECRMGFYEREESVEAKTGGLLFRGGFNGVATNLAFIKPTDEPLIALSNTVFCHFSKKISDLILSNVSNLQYILSTLTVKDASGLCRLYSDEDKEEKTGKEEAPKIKVSLSSRFNSIARGVGIFPNRGQRLSPRHDIYRSTGSSVALLSEPVSDTLAEEGQGFLQFQESRSLDKIQQSTISENLITVPSENAPITMEEDHRAQHRLSIRIPNFRA